MTSTHSIQLLKTLLSDTVPASNYSLWTVSCSDNVHVTCVPAFVPIIESRVDALIREHGGIRYATGYNAIGVLGKHSEANLVFHLHGR